MGYHCCSFHCFVPPTGKIACANVLSDLYAMGVTECDNMLMLLGVSSKLTDKERDVVVPLMMRGFKVGFVSTLLSELESDLGILCITCYRTVR